ncbi:MAG: hypothetical protein IKJ88_05500 [Clostridia bacterium]|nr:hypothetical protein [Clostridia bacterium]
MGNIIKSLKGFYEKYFKSHCPDCVGVMDSVWFDMTFDRMVYECRECKKRWM